MEDILNGSYLRAGGIWAALHRRKALARLASIKDLLRRHVTHTLYEDSRNELLQLISRKIGYKEKLISQFDNEFSDLLHRQITNAEKEINTLLSFVMAFDSMAEFMQTETAGFVDEWYKAQRQNLVLNQLLDMRTELHEQYSNVAHDLHDHILINRRSANQPPNHPFTAITHAA
ncbi:hypothetical protein [Spirosoma pomorum]